MGWMRELFRVLGYGERQAITGEEEAAPPIQTAHPPSVAYGGAHQRRKKPEPARRLGRSFTVIDVETANARYHSICQIGLVRFEEGSEAQACAFLVDPADEFAAFSVRLHGIAPERVRGAPRFPDLLPDLEKWLSGRAVVSHSRFDQSALRLACERWNAPKPEPLAWVDSIGVALVAFPDLAARGCRLNQLAAALDIPLRHHDALEDARAAGLIVARAMQETGLELDELMMRAAHVQLPRTGGAATRAKFKRTGDGDGALLGETLVFTGDLSISRGQAADMAAEAGADVHDNVTYNTTMLVVGERDLKPGWSAKSTKQRKAEELIAKGVQIRIVGEADFLRLAAITE